jgi:hypothetical protein
MTTKVNRVIAVLNLPHPVPALIKAGQAIVSAMSGNALLPNPNPSLATVTTEIDGLNSAETDTKTRAKGTVEVRNEKRATVVTSLHQLKGFVQQVSDANPAQAEAIITSAGMSVKKAAVRNKTDFAARPGPTSGTVHLIAKAATHRASYEWQWSADGGKTWQQAPSTLQSRTTLLALPLSVTCQFRFRPVTKTGEGDWSQVISLLVK